VFRQWRSEDGLPQDSVSAILQTRDGYLWIGTGCGLARFDGVRFEVLGADEGLPNLHIRVLLEDAEGVLWIGTSHGLCRLKRGKLTNWTTRDGLSGDIVKDLVEDREGAVWIGTTTGLNRWHLGKLEKKLEGRWVRSLLRDHKGDVWVCLADAGLMRWNGQDFVPASSSEEIKVLRPGGLWRDPVGRIWAAEGRRVVCVEANSVTTYGPADGLPDVIISCLGCTADGTVWAGTVDQGLYYLHEGRFHSVRFADGLPNEAIRVIVEDRERNLWVGTSGGGLIQVRPKGFRTLRLRVDKTDVLPLSLAQTDGEGLWVGTLGHGYYRLADGKQERYLPEEFYSSGSRVHVVFATHEGALWCGGGKVLVKSQGGGVLSTNYCAEVRCACEDGKGGLWIGTDSGKLLLLREGKQVDYSAGLPGAPLTALAQQSDGTLWIGTYGSGLVRLKDDRCEKFKTQEGLGSDIIRTLYLDSRGALWIGAEGGLTYLKGDVVRRFHKHNGLAAEGILQILEDDLGHIWLGTHQGIVRMSRRELDDLTAGITGEVHPRTWRRSDGLVSEQCVAGFNSGLKTQSGLLCFSTGHGIVIIDPKEQTESNAPPLIRLEKVLVERQPHVLPFEMPHGEANEPLRVQPGKSNLEFHYTGLQFSAPDKVRFRYRLTGLDPGWVEAGTRRAAYYSHVPPGDYRFEIAAHNGDGAWSESSASIAVKVLPHFWQTWWFATAVIGGMLGAAVSTVRQMEKAKARRQMQRLEWERAMERERARIAQDLHDDLGAGLTEIGLTTELIQDPSLPPAEAQEYLKEISARSRGLVTAMDEIVWAVNPRNDLVPSVAAYFSQFAQRFLRLAGIDCRLDIETGLPAVPLNAEQRHNLFLAFKEALTNVVKHANATQVRLVVRVEDSSLVVSLEDNGAGFTPGTASAGADGLNNIQDRLRRLGGSCVIASGPVRGTRMVLRLPLTRAGTTL
jgi:ligand-binding sensor domain-containing protein/signal transduction histidine kinase